jgi:hypothetical protein
MCSYDAPDIPEITPPPVVPSQEKDVRVGGKDEDKSLLRAKQKGIEAFLLPIIGGK